MSSRQQSRLHQATTLLATFEKHHAQLEKWLGDEWRSGYGTGSDEPAVSNSGISDPTGRTAVAQDNHPDPAAVDHGRIAVLIFGLQAIADELDVIRRRNMPPSTDEARRYAATQAADGKPGCWSCARIGQWADPHRSTTIGDTLPELRPFCRWCYSVISATGQPPNRQQVTDHHAGKRVNLKAS